MPDDVNSIEDLILQAVPKDDNWYKVSIWLKRTKSDEDSLFVDGVIATHWSR